MKNTSFAGWLAAILLFVFCECCTSAPPPGPTITDEEMHTVAVAAVNDVLVSEKFDSYLKQYREENGADAVPVLKLAKTLNNTDVTGLNTALITDTIFDALSNSGKVEVTMAEGELRTKAIPDSRDVKFDSNFDPNTVAGPGTLRAADLVLRPKVTSSMVREGRKQIVIRSFVLEMADIRTGLMVWSFSKQLGLMKERPSIGL